jgi:hypothetical protein
VDVGTLESTLGVSRFSVSAWIYQSSLAAGAIVSDAVLTNSYWYIASDDAWGGNDDIMVAIEGSGTALAYTTNSAHASGVWEHWIFVFDGTLSGNSNRLKLYKNGIQQSLSFSGTMPATTIDLSGSGTTHANIGGYYNAASWNGKIDDVRIYNRALSSGEILDLYNSGK